MRYWLKPQKSEVPVVTSCLLFCVYIHVEYHVNQPQTKVKHIMSVMQLLMQLKNKDYHFQLFFYIYMITMINA